MQVWKFGGTSVGKPERMHAIRNLVTADSGRKIVVLSALSGSTNALIAIGEAAKAGKKEDADNQIKALYDHYDAFIKELFSKPKSLEKGQDVIKNEFGFIRSLINIKPFGAKQEKEMVAEGEILSTQLFQAYLDEQGESSV